MLDNIWHGDGLSFYDSPSVSFVNVTTTPAKQLCGVDPDRVALVIAVPGGGGPVVSIGPTSLVTSTQGLTIGGQASYFTVLWQELGPLVNAAWFGISPASPTNVMVIEVFLRRNPEENGYVGTYTQRGANGPAIRGVSQYDGYRIPSGERPPKKADYLLSRLKSRYPGIWATGSP